MEDPNLPANARIECGTDVAPSGAPVLWVGKSAIAATIAAGPQTTTDPQTGADPQTAPGLQTAADLTCRLHPLAARQLRIPPAVSAHWLARWDTDGLHLGPVIGYFVGDGRAEDPDTLLSWITLRLAPCAVPGLLYAFTLDDVRLGHAAVNGRLWRAGRFAEPSALPLPDVVWKGSEAAAPWLPRLCDGRLFNERLSWNKAEVHAALAGHAHVPPALHVTLTEGTLDRDRAGIARLLVAGGAVYLKSVYGSLRVGVGRLSAGPEGWLAEDASGSVSGTPEQVLTAFRHRAPSPHGYLAQQAIPPLADGRRLDFRVIVQRGADARLSCTAIGALLGPPGGPFAKTRPNGSYYPARAALLEQGLPDDRADALLAAMAGGATDAAARLESAFGRIGETGLDITVDRDWTWWLLEANPRPGLLGFGGLEPERFPHIVGAPLQYAVTLAGYR